MVPGVARATESAVNGQRRANTLRHRPRRCSDIRRRRPVRICPRPFISSLYRFGLYQATFYRHSTAIPCKAAPSFFCHGAGSPCSSLWRLEGPRPYLHQCVLQTRPWYQGCSGTQLVFRQTLHALIKRAVPVSRRLAQNQGDPPQGRLLDHSNHQGLWASGAWRCGLP